MAINNTVLPQTICFSELNQYTAYLPWKKISQIFTSFSTLKKGGGADWPTHHFLGILLETSIYFFKA